MEGGDNDKTRASIARGIVIVRAAANINPMPSR